MELTVGGRVADVSTTVEPGVYTVAISSVAPQLGLELLSVYVGHPFTQAAATHLELGRGKARLVVEERGIDELPMTHARERLLLDHAARLRDLVDELAGEAAVDVGERALKLMVSPEAD